MSGVSFRDPDGVVVPLEDRVVRFVREQGIERVAAILALPVVSAWSAAGRLPQSRLVPADDFRSVKAEAETSAGTQLDRAFCGAVEHERVPFVSYPYEWSPEMLRAAALTTLDLAEELLPLSFGLKDATPFNILFNGAAPVFVDLLSIEKRDAADPIWLPYAQFVRCFLIPLLINRETGTSLRQIFTTSREGIEPEAAARMLPIGRRLSRPALTHVTLPHMLESSGSPDRLKKYSARRTDPESAQFTLAWMLKGLRKSIGRIDTRTASRWSAYTDGAEHPQAYHDAKKRVVVDFMRAHAARRVLDLGCNTGSLSVEAARAGARVVAVDSDEVSIDALYRTARADKLAVLPLVMDLGAPSPAAGWRNAEWTSFLDRARGRFDAVFAFALVHHLLLTERIPLNGIFDFLAGITTDFALVEYVPPDDSHFRLLLRGRVMPDREPTEDDFVNESGRHFDILNAESLPGTGRKVLVLRKKSTPALS